MLRMPAVVRAGMFILVTTMASASDFPDDLEKWITIPTPRYPRINDSWIIANNDFEHEWVVSLRDGRPRVHLRGRKAEAPAPLPFEIEPGSARDGLSGERLGAKVSDGWIVAFNAGEFGAGLWWFSNDGMERYKISEAWIRAFIPTEAGLVALEGLAHGTISEGRLIRVARGPGGRWKSEDLVDLKHAPEVGLRDADGTLIVATTDRLLRVAPASREVDVLLDHAFWGGLYPNSMVVTSSGTIYLGMRHGVAKVEKNDGSYRALWLVPNREFADMKRKDGFK